MRIGTHTKIQVMSVIVIPVPFEIYQISRIRIKAKHFHLIKCHVIAYDDSANIDIFCNITL